MSVSSRTRSRVAAGLEAPAETHQETWTLADLRTELQRRSIALGGHPAIEQHSVHDGLCMSARERTEFNRGEAIAYLRADDAGLRAEEVSGREHGFRWHIVERIWTTGGDRDEDEPQSPANDHLVGDTIYRTREECERFMRESGEFQRVRQYGSHHLQSHTPPQDALYAWEFEEDEQQSENTHHHFIYAQVEEV